MIIVKQIALSCVNRNIPCFELNHQFVYSIIDHFLFMNKLVSLVVLSIEREREEKEETKTQEEIKVQMSTLMRRKEIMFVSVREKERERESVCVR